MDEQPGVSDEVRLSSPWPIFVALGLALSEVGIVLNLIPISVGGLLLFVGSIAGIVQDAGYVDRPWNLLSALGALLVVLGGILVVWQVSPAVGALVDAVATSMTPQADSVVQRGLSVALAGLVCILGGVVGRATGRRGIESP